MTVPEFESLVANALDTLPEQFAAIVDNVEVVVEVWPTPEELAEGNVPPGMTLFGLYHGLPQTLRSNYTGVLPDKIIIFMGPILEACGHHPDAIKIQVRNTLLHELGHHFGMNDAQIRNTGK